MVELTVPWEDGMDTAAERKKEKYTDLAGSCHQAGWKTSVFPVAIGCRGLVGVSTQWLLASLGFTGYKLKRATKVLTEEGEEGSFWLWLHRKDKAFEKQEVKMVRYAVRPMFGSGTWLPLPCIVPQVLFHLHNYN